MENFKDTEEYFILPDNWLKLHKFHNECGSNLVRELENLFHCAANTLMKIFVGKDFLHWDTIINRPQFSFQSFIHRLFCFKRNQNKVTT